LSLYNQDDVTSFGFCFDDDKAEEEANRILKSRNWSKSKKVFELGELYNNLSVEQNFEIHWQGTDKKTKDFLEGKNKQQKALFTAVVVGNEIDLAVIFENPTYSNKNNEQMPKTKDFKYSLDVDKYEEWMAKIRPYLTSAEMEVIEKGKDVYESIVLCNILTKDSLSASMVEKYELHKTQLKALKQYVYENHSREIYLKIFGLSGVYSRYVNNGTSEKSLARDEFYAELKKIVPKYVELEEIASEIEFERLLPKQRISDNGSIPYQIHEYELLKIIENQSKYYSFLTDETDRLGQLIKFRIPYYVGPLAKAGKSNFAWMQRYDGKEDVGITPWNFDDVVDKEASNVEFIERMTSFCTYLPHEKVLPDNSLTYQEFKIYNELMICGYEERGKCRTYFSASLRLRIVDELFKKQKKVTAKDMAKFLYNNCITDSELSVSQLFGIDTAVKSPSYNTSYNTYIDLVKRIGLSDSFIEQNKPALEQIIKWATIFKDREILQKTISRANDNEWNGLFSIKQIKELSKLRYTGWGRLSAKLLTGIRCVNGKSILGNLKEENYNNFMRLLEDEKVKNAIKNAQLKGKESGTLNYGLVDELAGSPAIKKGIGQSLKIIKELERVLKVENIDKIVIEMARGDETKGKRTLSRRKQIEKMYQNFAKNTEETLPEDIRRDFLVKTNEKDFDNERLFLYFLQNGKCMYTHTTLEIDNLSNYDVDHIIPQAYIKDDSLDNKVLVLKDANRNKRDSVPSKEIVKKMTSFWDMLARNGQVSPKKLANLKRGNLSEDAKEGFINRQLVETRQIIKHLVNILANHYKDTEIEILTPRANLARHFRKEFELVKNRDINDHHHAHDAYLNAIVSNYIYNKRPDLKELWVYGKYPKGIERKKGDKFLEQLLEGVKDEGWVDMTTGETFADRDEVLNEVRKTLDYRTVHIVKKTEIKSGKFGDETVYKKDPQATPVKQGLEPSRYGGTKSPISAFAVIVQNKKGGIKAVSIPAMQEQGYRKMTDDEKLNLLQKNNPKDGIVKVIVDAVPKFAKFKLPSGAYRLVKSYQESGPALQTKTIQLPAKESEDKDFDKAYDILVDFIEANMLVSDAKVTLLRNEVRQNFKHLSADDKEGVIKDLAKLSKGSNQGLKWLKKAGGFEKERLTTSANLIKNDTVLIYQSPTGLFETRRKI